MYNGGNMRVQKFTPHLIEKIIGNWPNRSCRNLLYSIRDSYILSDDKVISVTQEFIEGNPHDPNRKRLTAKIEIEDKEEGFDIICSIETKRCAKTLIHPTIETTVFSIKNKKVSKITTTVKVEKTFY